jgi:glutathionylspermidine synthase
MRTVSRLFLLAALPAALAVSCVSPKVHAELQSNYDLVVAENEAMKVRTDKASTALVECEAKRARIDEAYTSLQRDTTQHGSQYRTLLRKYQDLEANYDYALKNNNTLAAANLRENKVMLEQMEKIAQRLALNVHFSPVRPA